MRKRDLKTSDPYYAQWMAYQRVQWRSLALVILLFWGGAGLSAIVLAAIVPHAPLWAWPAVVLPWVIAAIVASQPAITAPCPRCGKPFHMTFWYRSGSTSWYHNGFARRCVHCALPKWAPRDPEVGRKLD